MNLGDPQHWRKYVNAPTRLIADLMLETGDRLGDVLETDLGILGCGGLGRLHVDGLVRGRASDEHR